MNDPIVEEVRKNRNNLMEKHNRSISDYLKHLKFSLQNASQPRINLTPKPIKKRA